MTSFRYTILGKRRDVYLLLIFVVY